MNNVAAKWCIGRVTLFLERIGNARAARLFNLAKSLFKALLGRKKSKEGVGNNSKKLVLDDDSTATANKYTKKYTEKSTQMNL
ncbi:jg18089 [Pararge aegeria aegeria]|uniref:Jg18089 protein n=1 Tax=Pararge aegeria aegeria TaxID=348720 RepID=A0A8S4S4M6_9NEOP|nr:jg18089 [Pararge aegeria aegeria]